ncbi:MAG: secretion system protein, partial [Methylobacterium sp.]
DTPYLVKPVDSPDQIALPTDGYKSPTDIERVLLGKLTSGQSGEKRPVPTVSPELRAAPVAGFVQPQPVLPAMPPRSPAPAPVVREQAIVPPKTKKGAAVPGFSD